MARQLRGSGGLAANPYSQENTPITVIREDRYSEASAAVQALVTGNLDT